jgi:hypothetical protein
MTPSEMAIVLKLFKIAWPVMPVEDYTAHVWAEACHGLDGQDAVIAGKRLVKSEERPPSIARFIEEAKLVARNRQERLEAGPTVGALSHNESLDRLRSIRRGLKVAAAMVPEHRHGKFPGVGKHGPLDAWKQCPACSTAEERRPALLAAIREELGPHRTAEEAADHARAGELKQAEAEVDASYGPLVSAGTTGAMATRRRRD